MKIERFTENNEVKIPSDLAKFAEWCLLTKKYAFLVDMNGASWYEAKTLKKLSWDDIYSYYTAKNYNL